MGFGLTKSAAVTAVLGTVPRAVLAPVAVVRARVPRPVLGHVWVVAQQVVVVVVLVVVGEVARVVVAAPAEAHVLLPVVARVLLVVQVTAKGPGRSKEAVYDFVKKYQRPSRGRRRGSVQEHGEPPDASAGQSHQQREFVWWSTSGLLRLRRDLRMDLLQL